MKVYIACLYGNKEQAKYVRDGLVVAGHECTARWLDGTVGRSAEEHRANADLDLEDVRRSDAVVHLALAPGSMYSGGGRQVEFGYALALGKPIVILGPLGETVFHYATGRIYHADTLRRALVILANLAPGAAAKWARLLEAITATAAEAQAKKLLERNGRNPANAGQGIKVGSPLHLCEMLVAQIQEIRTLVGADPVADGMVEAHSLLGENDGQTQDQI